MENRFEGEWSSIRPLPDVSPTDMERNGVFKFEKFNPDTGEVSGTYYDLEAPFETYFTGTITRSDDPYHVYHFSLEYDDDTIKAKIKYDGYLVAQMHEITIVAGTWDTVRTEDSKTAQRGPGGIRQEDGVWVATKP